MAHSGLCCGLYRGTFYLKDNSNPNGALLEVGNAEATISQEITDIEQPNFQSLGGSACKVSYTESVSLELTLHCTSPENLAIAFLGDTRQLTGAAVVNEVHPVNSIDELIPFVHIPRKDTPIVVTNVAGTTTYVVNVDYVVTNAGIRIIEGSTIPVDGTAVHVDYSYGNNWFVNAQTTAQKEFQVVLDGYNVGDAGELPVVLKAWKVKFAPAESFALIAGTEFASLVIDGEILRDDSKTVDSKFFTVEFGVAGSGGY